MKLYEFAAHDRFLNRSADLERLNDWWQGNEPNALALFGRRRVGKSWLHREFAHGKPALILVADTRSLGPQLGGFAAQLEPLLGVKPELDGLPSLFRALYEVGRSSKTLVTIDELPYLLPSQETERRSVLTEVQKVMEDRDESSLKLVLCGSYIGQMEALLTGPLRGRLTPMRVDPLDFRSAREFMPNNVSSAAAIERFAVSGGMSFYLDELCRGISLRERVTTRALNSRGPLFNDPREILEEELRRPGVYYSLLEEISHGRRSIGELSAAIGSKATNLQGYLETLIGMQLVRRLVPVTEGSKSRRGQFELADDFMRFWFRFIFPFQEDLKSGLSPADLYRIEVEPQLSDHVAPVWERLCRGWVLSQGTASRVGAWWGLALNKYRRTGERQTEEIDLVGVTGSRVSLVGECKWTSGKMHTSVLRDLETFKLPALEQSGARVVPESVQIVLCSRSGFERRLVQVASERDDLDLIGPEELSD